MDKSRIRITFYDIGRLVDGSEVLTNSFFIRMNYMYASGHGNEPIAGYSPKDHCWVYYKDGSRWQSFRVELA